MTIDLTSEPVFPLKEADFPSRRRGKRVHYATLWRWSHHGVRGIRLETTRLGNTLYTSHAAIQRFADALSEQPSVPPAPRTPRARQRASERAERELNRIGI